MSSYKTLLNGVRTAVKKVECKVVSFIKRATEDYNKLAYVPIYETPIEDVWSGEITSRYQEELAGFPTLVVGSKYRVTIGYNQYDVVANCYTGESNTNIYISDVENPLGGSVYSFAIVYVNGAATALWNTQTTYVGDKVTVQLIGEPVEVGKEWLHDYVDEQNQGVAEAAKTAQATADDAVSLWDNVVINYSKTVGNTEISPKTSVAIFPNVTTLGGGLFIGCHNLIAVYAPAATIIQSAFRGCSRLKSLAVPSGVSHIDAGVLEGCSGVTSIVVAEENTRYHSDGNCLINTTYKTLIAGCKTSVIPADGSVTSIDDSAFTKNAGLSSIVIPTAITDIGRYAFYECASLASITYTGTMEQWNAVTKDAYWHSGVPATEVVCSDGSVPLATET